MRPVIRLKRVVFPRSVWTNETRDAIVPNAMVQLETARIPPNDLLSPLMSSMSSLSFVANQTLWPVDHQQYKESSKNHLLQWSKVAGPFSGESEKPERLLEEDEDDGPEDRPPFRPLPTHHNDQKDQDRFQ